MSAQGILATIIATELTKAVVTDHGETAARLLLGPAVAAYIREIAESVAPRKHECRGIPRPGCHYLTACDTVCNKCGQVHSTNLLTVPTGFTANEPVETAFGMLPVSKGTIISLAAALSRLQNEIVASKNGSGS